MWRSEFDGRERCEVLAVIMLRANWIKQLKHILNWPLLHR